MSFAQRIKDYMKKTGTTQKTMAEMIDMSPASFSLFLAGKYAGDTGAIEKKLTEALNLEEAQGRARSRDLAYAVTEQQVSAQFVLDYAHRNGTFGMVVGSSGTGKTTAIRSYLEKTVQSVIVVTGVPNMPVSSILDDILEALGIDSFDGGQNQKIKRIISSLKNRHVLLVIDEAQHLQIYHFDTIRRIYDALSGGMGMVLMGTRDLMSRMTDKKRLPYDQVTSRIEAMRELPSVVSSADVELILKNSGISASREIIDFLGERANEMGHYRRLRAIYSQAVSIAEESGEELGTQHLETALQLMWPTTARRK